MVARFRRGGANLSVAGREELLQNRPGRNTSDQRQRRIVAGDGIWRVLSERLEQIHLGGGGRDVLVAQAGRPADGVVVARRMVASLAAFVELPGDDVIALKPHAVER